MGSRMEAEKLKLEALKNSDFYKKSPPKIQEVMVKFPPGNYRLKSSNNQCFIAGYIGSDPDHEDPKHRQVTFVVIKTGVGGEDPENDKGLHLGGITVDDIEPWYD